MGKLGEDSVDGLAAIKDVQCRASKLLAYLDELGRLSPAKTVTTAGDSELNDVGVMIAWGWGLRPSRRT